MDSDSETELSKLHLFFTGFEAGLKSLREVRSAFDEEVAFDFNPLIFFSINENTVSDILAYFLNPEAEHGQQDRLLKVFLQHVLYEKDLKWIESQNPTLPIKVDTQLFTDYRRPIDTVITFGNNEFIIGIENKVWSAVDQENQINDYILDIMAKSNNNFLMLYLSPRGEAPSGNSITPGDLKKYKDNDQFKIIPFCSAENKDSVLSILKAMADAARADSVRSFLKFFIKFLSTRFTGGTTVDEQTFYRDYLVQNPAFFADIPGLKVGYDSVKMTIQEAFLSVVQRHLNKRAGNDNFTKWPKDQGDDLKYDTILPESVYITLAGEGIMGLYCNYDSDNHNANPNCVDCMGIFKEGLDKVREALSRENYSLSTNQNFWRWLIAVPRPSTELSHAVIVDILNEKNTDYELSSTIEKEALKIANFIWKFITILEDEWKIAGLPCKCTPPIVVK